MEHVNADGIDGGLGLIWYGNPGRGRAKDVKRGGVPNRAMASSDALPTAEALVAKGG
jgi:hypothetical protein